MADFDFQPLPPDPMAGPAEIISSGDIDHDVLISTRRRVAYLEIAIPGHRPMLIRVVPSRPPGAEGEAIAYDFLMSLEESVRTIRQRLFPEG